MAGPGVLRLADDTLAELPASVATPRYDRSALVTGIVHVGVGGFHRAHQAMYLDRLLRAGAGDGWAICGVGLLPADRAVSIALTAQHGLYTLALAHADGRREVRVIGSIARYLYAPDDPQAVIATMADPVTRIVSLTITEGGYNISHSTGEFDATAPDVVHDLAHPEAARTVFGLIAAALDLRRRAGVAPFTVMSCDNVPGNGQVARRSVTAFAHLRDPALARWIDERGAFPDSMVDRITPVATPADVRRLAEDTGVLDAAPVLAEPFEQWVLADDFADGRPPLERAGVQLVGDVAPYEMMKLRLLNAAHQVLCYLAALAGFRYVHEAVADPAFAALLRRYMSREAAPTLHPVPGIDVGAYCATLLERFGNAHVADTLARLGVDGSDRIPKFLLPVITDQLARGGDITVSALAVAGWARFLRGTDDEGRPLDVSDSKLPQLRAVLARPGDPAALVRTEEVVGALSQDPRFVAAYLEAVAALGERGARGAVEDLTTSEEQT